MKLDECRRRMQEILPVRPCSQTFNYFLCEGPAFLLFDSDPTTGCGVNYDICSLDFIAKVRRNLQNHTGMGTMKEDMRQETVLVFAAGAGNAEVVSCLVRAGEVTAQSDDFAFAVCKSDTYGHHFITVLLLSLSAPPFDIDWDNHVLGTELRNAAATVVQARHERCSDVQSALADDLPPDVVRSLVAGYADDAVDALRAMWVGEESGGAWDITNASDMGW